MWKLSKLEIRGFKSFADSAALDFPQGITAVVGPNGCGKSNISDAILWVLGEQSTRALRAHRMQDVIFQGTATRRAIGLAEVTLHLTHQRNGNGNGSGNGYDPLADLEGGSELSAAAGEEVEAAPIVAADGIAIDTSGDIEIDAADDLGDVDADAPVQGGNGARGKDAHGNGANGKGDGVLKITRRLFRSGDSEYLLNSDKCRLRDIREHLSGTGLGARACFLIGQGKIDQILSASSLERRAPLEEAAGITLYRQRRHLTQLKLEATAQDLARIDDIYQEVGRQMRSLKRQAGRARRYKALRDELRRLERGWLYGELVELQQRSSLAAAAADGARVAEQTARDKLETAAAKLAEARNRLRSTRLAEQERRQRLYQGQLEQERLRAESQRQLDRVAFAEERLGELTRRVEELGERLDETAGMQERREELLGQSEQTAEVAAQALLEAEEELEAARRRLRLAMRPAANAPPEESDEPRPLSADIVVEEGDFAALSLALGDLLDAKLLSPKLLDPWLEETLAGRRASRVVRDVGAAIAEVPPDDDRVIGALHARISGRTEPAKAVVRALLRNTWVVPDAADVPELAARHVGDAFVDLAGACWACGVEVRVRGRQAMSEALAARRAAREAEQSRDGAEDEATGKATGKAIGKTTEKATDGGAGKPAGGRESERREPDVTSPEELAARGNRDRAAAAARAATGQADAARQELAVAEAAQRRLKAERERIVAEIEGLQDAVEVARGKAADAKRQAAEAGKATAAIEAELEDEVSNDHAGEAEVAGLETAQAQGRAEVERAQEVRSGREVEAAEARVAGGNIEQRVRERLSMEPAELIEIGPVDPEAEEEPEPTGRRRRSKAAEEIDVTSMDARSLRLLIREIQKTIEGLGPVNLMAYEDFEAQESRHQELGTQRSDLKDAASNLDEAIRRIDTDCVTRFNDCFESINGYFNRIFRQLFGGGKAGMRLEEPDDPLNTGIEIFAQPPGKKLQNIRLLSGGERTLVALSLLFAIFEYRPAAFCILDEADAALDEINVDRFVRALHSFENRTQFILITHNKRTMEIADLLYGVTMQESGVSQLVSVQLH